MVGSPAKVGRTTILNYMSRIIFMGTPEFAVPSLVALAAQPEFKIVAVVTQPDAQAGRGKHLTQSPVKQWAVGQGLPVLQPPSLKPPEVLEQLRAYQSDVIVVAAFGQILRRTVLEMPPHGCVNVHGSLLPRWRGASPVSAAIAAGDATTGITIMRMDVGLDSGPMLSARAETIHSDDTAGSLLARLAHVGAALLVETLPRYLRGEIAPQPQDESQVTLCRQIKKEEGRINWQGSATELDRHVRAMLPWPGAFTLLHGKLLKIGRVRVTEVSEMSGVSEVSVGQVRVEHGTVCVQCRTGTVQLIDVQPEGKKMMSAADFARGQQGLDGVVLGA